MFATISADIVSSTSLSVDETIGLKQRIAALFALLRELYPDFQGRQIKGDYIECVMSDVGHIFRVALILKSCIKSFPVEENERTRNFRVYGLRMAIGIGEMRIVDTEQGIWDGEAIYLSGRTLNEMSALSKGAFSIRTNKRRLAAPLQAIASLTDAVVNSMTARQSQVAYYKLLGWKETEISRQLGIAQSGVNKASSALKWYSIEEALNCFEHINFDEDE